MFTKEQAVTPTFFKLISLMMNACLTKPVLGASGNIVFDVTLLRMRCFYSEFNALGLFYTMSTLVEDNGS